LLCNLYIIPHIFTEFAPRLAPCYDLDMSSLPILKDPTAFESFTLSNGIPVYIRPCEQVFGLPKIAGSVAFRVGARDDVRGKQGTAHFFEHMPFRGTKKFPTLLDLTHQFELASGYINAFTSFEATAYEFVAPTELLDHAIARLSDMTTSPMLREHEIELEREVIIEELRNKLSNVGFYARQELYKALLGDHPLTSSVVGDEEALKSITKKDLEAFHSRWYHAGTMALFFTGSIDRDVLQSLCETYFGTIANKDDQPSRVQDYAMSGTDDYILTRKPSQYNRSVYLLGRAFPSADMRQSLMLKLYADMLDRGMTSPLGREIREKRGLAYGYNVYVNRAHDVSVYAVLVNTRGKNMEEVDRIVWEQMHHVLEDQNRFDEIKKAIEQSWLYREHTLGSVMDYGVDDWIDYNRILPTNELLATLKDIQLDDLQSYIHPLLDKSQFKNVRVICD
jgi:predicted Zn-dependent peptidase